MKRLYIAITLITLAITICIFEQYTVESTYKYTTNIIEQTINYVDEYDYNNAEINCNKLANYWQKKYPYLTAMMDHSTLDDISITIDSLEDLAKEKSDNLSEELITAKSQIETMRKNQKISFGNIF